MSELEERVKELRGSGNNCAQVTLTLTGLDPKKIDNPELLQAAKGLGFGTFAQHACGSYTGACLGLALYITDREELSSACKELSEWFIDRFGGIDCREVLERNGQSNDVCAETMAEVPEYCLDMLADKGYL